MRKRITLLFALLTVAVLLFAACDGTPSVADLQKYNDMLKVDYSEVTVVVNTKTAVAELNGTFTMTFVGEDTNIKYEFDRINTFDVDASGNAADAEGGFIVREKGEVVVRGKEIVDGDASVELPLDQLSFGGFSFKQAFFAKVNMKNAKFEADVVNPQNFTGNTSLVCTDMHVVVMHNVNTNTLTSIELTYTADSGAAVKINYLFTK